MSTQLPLNQRIDKTKLEKHPSGDGWLVPMRNGEKAQVLCFERKGFQEQILGLNEDYQTIGWLPDGRFIGTHENRFDLMLAAYIDPYAELKAAHKAGRVIQMRGPQPTDDDWTDQPNPQFGAKPERYRIKPEWTLGRSVNGFTLGDGQEWHRNDFTEGMLTEGWRPLIKGESLQFNDGDQYGAEYQLPKGSGPRKWESFKGLVSSSTHMRTRRPLPEVKKPVPLGPEDVKCGDEIRQTHWLPNVSVSIIGRNEKGVWWFNATGDFRFTTYDDLRTGYEISRDGGETWEACSK